MSNVILIPLVGLPGAGKTTFVKNLLARLEQIADADVGAGLGAKLPSSGGSLSGRVDVFHFHYDDFLPAIESSSEPMTGRTKSFRKAVVAIVDAVVVQEKEIGFESRDEIRDFLHSVAVNHEGAAEAVQSNPRVEEISFAVRRVVEAVVRNGCFFHFSFLSSSSSSSQHSTLVILDDNNHLRSQRYEFYQVARRHRIGFLQVFLSVSMANAKIHNARRSSPERVTDDVIGKMAANMELTNQKMYPWERRSWTILIGGEENGEAGERESPLEEEEDEEKRSSALFLSDLYLPNEIDKILRNLLIVAGDVVAPRVLVDDADEDARREEDRSVGLNNVVHQADVKLRALVGKRMKSLKGAAGAEVTEEAERVGRIKAFLLERIRTGELALDLEGINSELENMFEEALME